MQTEQTSEREQTAWSEIDRAAAEAVVKRLQDRIYRAAAAGKRRQVKNLQKLLVRSTSAKRLAVRRLPSRTRVGIQPASTAWCVGRPRAERGCQLVWN